MRKDNTFWVYHSDQLDTYQQESEKPHKKLWLALRQTVTEGLGSDDGYPLVVGDIIKLGRMRFRVTITQSQQRGREEFDFQNKPRPIDSEALQETSPCQPMVGTFTLSKQGTNNRLTSFPGV
jgi:hypothetical protein